MSNIVTVPLNIVSRETNKHIKNASAQLRATYGSASQELTLVAACEEGIFEAQISLHQLHQAKSKPDLDSATWQRTLLELLGVREIHGLESGLGNTGLGNTASESTGVVETEHTEHTEHTEYTEVAGKTDSKLVLNARLTTDDSYDDETGELMPECGEKLPEFELFVNTSDVLSILYGRLVLPFKDVEVVPYTKRAHYNMLTWVGDLVSENKRLRGDLHETHHNLAHQISVCEALENEVHQMTSDYGAILQDLENRFFQVLNEKRRKIAQLEPEGEGNLALLNLEYVKRNSTNLNRVFVEDIVAGRKLVCPSKRSRARKRPREGKNISSSPVKREIKMEQVVPKMEENSVELDSKLVPKLVPKLKKVEQVEPQTSGENGPSQKRTRYFKATSEGDEDAGDDSGDDAREVLGDAYEDNEGAGYQENEGSKEDTRFDGLGAKVKAESPEVVSQESGVMDEACSRAARSHRRASDVSSASTHYSGSEMEDEISSIPGEGGFEKSQSSPVTMDIALPDSESEDSGDVTQYSE